jgi:tetratricopeptide (TPR) repeat protein
MVDLSKHMARAKQALERRNWEMAIAIGEECQEVDPVNIEVYRLLVDAAKRQAKESGKKGLLGGLSMPSFSKDPQKQLSTAMKRVSSSPDAKAFAAAGDAAMKVHQSGIKGAIDVAIYLFEEVRATGLFNEEVLWNLANLYYARFQETKDGEALERALKTMGELERAKPNHPEAGRSIKNWEAMRSMVRRSQGATAGGGTAATTDYRSQLSSDEKARRQEIMNRLIRGPEDAVEVMKYVDEDLQVDPSDKSLWLKKGDIHRRINEFAEAKAAYIKAQELDAHDFVVTMRLGEVRIFEAQQEIEAMAAAGQDVTAARQQLNQMEIDEYKRRVERQPTEMNHHFELGRRHYQAGNIEAAASEFQQTVRDQRLRRPSHRFLGACFTKKKLFDLAVQQYDSYLKLAEDDSADEAKDVRYSVGRILEEQGKKEQAANHYRRLVEIDLGYKDAATRLGALGGG